MVLTGSVLAGFEVVVRDAEARGDEGDSRERTASNVAATAIVAMQATATQVKGLRIPLVLRRMARGTSVEVEPERLRKGGGGLHGVRIASG